MPAQKHETANTVSRTLWVILKLRFYKREFYRILFGRFYLFMIFELILEINYIVYIGYIKYLTSINNFRTISKTCKSRGDSKNHRKEQILVPYKVN